MQTTIHFVVNVNGLRRLHFMQFFSCKISLHWPNSLTAKSLGPNSFAPNWKCPKFILFDLHFTRNMKLLWTSKIVWLAFVFLVHSINSTDSQKRVLMCPFIQTFFTNMSWHRLVDNVDLTCIVLDDVYKDIFKSNRWVLNIHCTLLISAMAVSQIF